MFVYFKRIKFILGNSGKCNFFFYRGVVGVLCEVSLREKIRKGFFFIFILVICDKNKSEKK